MASQGPGQLREWFAAHAAPMVLYARQWLPVAQAEDVVQDVFVRLMDQQVSPAHVKAWLFRAVRNAAISELRSMQRRAQRERSVATGRAEWFVPRNDDRIDAAAVQEKLAGLPPVQREVVVLRIWGDLTLQEIADLLDQPVSTTFSQYRAALDQIRKSLELPCRNND